MKNIFLPSEKDENGNIPGIYNYCNKICERCNFTTMCLCYKMEQSFVEDRNLDDSMNNSHDIQESLQQPVDLLLDHAEREYDDPTEDLSDDSTEDSISETSYSFDEEDKIISDYEIIKMANEYCNRAREAFDKLDDVSDFQGKENTSAIQNDIKELSEKGKLDEYKEWLAWVNILSFIIFVKLKRAASGYFNSQLENDDEFEAYDMNGSAKCALVSIDESIDALLAAHTYIPSFTEQASDLQIMLFQLKSAAEVFFPDARAFIRPGLDE